MLAVGGGASASRRRPDTVSCVPRGRIQRTLLPSGPATMRTASHPAQMVRSALMYHGPDPNGSAFGSRGGTARMASVTRQESVASVPGSAKGLEADWPLLHAARKAIKVTLVMLTMRLIVSSFVLVVAPWAR